MRRSSRWQLAVLLAIFALARIAPYSGTGILKQEGRAVAGNHRAMRCTCTESLHLIIGQHTWETCPNTSSSRIFQDMCDFEITQRLAHSEIAL